MEFVHGGLGALAAAVAISFTTLVTTKAAAVTFIARGIYWLTIGCWVNRIKTALMGY